ncbi:MAG: hypothetical protein PHI27_02745 [Eubacteriales bacterium]|nr:hypothetical protein [Eubacteriales bacterium]MDD4511534.1 hypothetical protein [Eubacteriales bacterium]
MLFDTFYYYTSMFKVYAAIILIVFAFPLVMWREYLRDKRYSFRFLFCVITQSCFCINLVLLLGFIGICNTYTIIAGFIAEYVVVTRRFKSASSEAGRNSFIKNIARNKLPGRRLFSSLFKELRRSLRSLWVKIVHMPLWNYLLKNWFIVLVMGAAVIYNAAFFTHNTNIYHSYQCSDIPVHQSWLYALEHGTLFVDGIYPFGMHSMIYVIRVLTGINLREILLYYGSFMALVVMLSMYCLARKIFKGRCTALLPVVLFSILMNNDRYAASLPQETGMFAVITLAYFMLEFLHSTREKHFIKSDSRVKRAFRINQYFFRRYLTVDVLLITLSVALVIEYHFYTAIAAVMMVIALALAFLPRLIHKQYWVPLMSAGFLGALIALAPFGACLMKGIPFQESMAWATSVIKGEKWEGTGSDYLSLLEQNKDTAAGSTASVTTAEGTAEKQRPQGLISWIRAIYNAELNFGGGSLFGNSSALLMLICMAAAVFSAFIYAMFKSTRFVAGDYLGIALYVLIISIMGCAEELGIIALVAPSRASVFIQPILFILYAIPVDAVLRPLLMVKLRALTAAVTALSVAVSGFAGYYLVKNGHLHHFFDVNLAYYNEPEYLIRKIKQEFPRNSYIIVSSTEEYYEILDYGYHTEISEFVNMLDKNEKPLTLPSQYVFFFVEKHVLQDYYHGSVDVAPNFALDDFVYMASNQDYYFQRSIIESKAYYWALKCAETYPNTFKVYFEDDIYIAFLLEQNTFYPYNLKLDYKTTLLNGEVTADE